MLKLVLALALLVLTSVCMQQDSSTWLRVNENINKINTTVTVGNEIQCAVTALSTGK